MMNEVEVCVITRIGPDRLWELDLWADSLERLDLPRAATRIVVGDNSGNAQTRLLLADILAKGGWAEWAILLDTGYSCAKFDTRPEEHSYHQARLLSRLVRASMEAPYIITLDSDTLAPSREDLGGLSAYEMMRGRLTGDVAVVGTPARSRNTGDISVYTVNTIEPWGKLVRVAAKKPGVVEEVQAFGTCLTLWRGDLLRKYEFKGEPNLTAKCGQGLEWYTYKMFLQDGWRLLCDWAIRPKHFLRPGDYVQV